MTLYTKLNIAWLSLSVLASCFLLHNARSLLRTARVAAVVVIIAFPWDFIAIANRAWDYGTPGFRVLGVPINDSIFIFACSLFASSALLSRNRRPRTGRIQIARFGAGNDARTRNKQDDVGTAASTLVR